MRKVAGTSTAPQTSPNKQVIGRTVAGPYATDNLGLSMYQTPPDVEVSVREFEEFTRDRLKVLHVFDRLCTYETRLESMGALLPKVKKELIDSHLALEYPSGLDADSFEARKNEFTRRDSVSHFVMRLAFCKTHDAREWFVRNEQRLFVLRYELLRPEAQEAFVAASGIKCRKMDISTLEGKMKLQELQNTTPSAKIWAEGASKPQWDNNFYTMPFFELDPRMVASRRVIVEGGMGYVPGNALKMILAKRFKDALYASMEQAFQGMSASLADPRIGGFIRDLQDYGMQLLVAPKTANTEDVGAKLSLENFEEMLLRSFPPCMRRTVEKQRETKKHLKHAGRLQLRPFLKECGFTIDESIKWWKQELCRDPTIDAASYEKNYTYDTEHTYGKKGHLQGQNAFGCPKVINFPAEAAGQCHGCVFKNLEGPALKQQMHKWKVPDRHVLEMEKLVSNGKHYQLACIEYFAAMHPESEGNGVGNAPHDFFRESCRYHTKKMEKELGNTPMPSGSPEKALAPAMEVA